MVCDDFRLNNAFLSREQFATEHQIDRAGRKSVSKQNPLAINSRLEYIYQISPEMPLGG